MKLKNFTKLKNNDNVITCCNCGRMFRPLRETCYCGSSL